MQFSSHATGQDINTQISFLTDTTTTDFSLNDRTRNANIAYHKFVAVIQQADGKWQFDDANNTTLPIATTTLTSGQRDYSLDDDMVEIQRVEIKDTSGNWSEIKPIDLNEITGAVDEYFSTNGQPLHYDKQGRTLLLYPAPNYTQAASLKVYFKRPASIFSTTDTTKSAGFDEMFHDYIPTYAAYMYCLIYKPNLAARLAETLKDIEERAKKFYGRRSKDERPIMRPLIIRCD